ncbi:MAG: tricorn protease [Dokdonia sp.]|jgi:tricorn protease
MKKIFTLLTWASASVFGYAQTIETPDALMLRYPDVSANEITFVYAEDVWVAPIDGGMARRITSTTGMELHPKFSPDGNTIAFSGNYDGNFDVYTINHQGFNLNRVTYHPGNDRMVDWNPNGESILFSSGRKSPSNRFNQFYSISSKGGNAERLPLFFAEIGSYNADGSKLAFQYLNRTTRTWKRYQGGTASDVLIYDFKTNKSTQITTYKGTDAIPMWSGDKIYFLSDRGDNHKANIWSYNTTDESFNQETNFDTYDVKFPSIGNGHIVLENGGKLHLLDLASGETKAVEIQVPSEQIMAREEWKDLSKSVRTYFISPTGKRGLFDSRGEIFTVPAESGITQNITNTSNASEQSPNWSPDGKYICYFSDASGEYQLMRRLADGTGEPEALTTDLSGYHFNTLWSPDSKKIAFNHFDGSAHYMDVDSKKVTEFARSVMNDVTDFKWSSDSKYITYSTPFKSQNGQVVIYSLKDKSDHIVTSEFYSCDNPVFSRDGKYLFYTSNRHFMPTYSNFDGTWVYNKSVVLMATTLSKDEVSILTPSNDVEEVKSEEEKDKDKDKDKDDKSDEQEDAEEEEMVIDYEGMELRSVKLPVDPGQYGNLTATDGKLIYGSYSDGGPAIKFWEFEGQEENAIIEGAFGYELSADGKKIMYGSNGGYSIVEVSAGKKPGDGSLNLKDMRAKIDPVQEWNQIFNEAWRLERDFFYDSNMHGVDWDEVKTRYGKLMPFCTSRSDLNYIIGEMIGELNVGHAYVGGGDMPRAQRIGVGMLGADLTTDSKGAIKIDKIYQGAPWDVTVRSPFNGPGVNVKEGEYITAVNHIAVDGTKSPYAAFQSMNSKMVVLTVASSADGKDARDVEIKLMSNEARLRNLAWIEANRQKVLEATDGRCGYIYVPNTGVQGQNELFRMYQGQFQLDAMIIDERWNSGGQIPDRFVELLNRPIRSHFSRRDKNSMTIPFNGMDGPKVMLANQWAGSGGDMFPYIFKQEKVGPVVGKRTWGGLVGISGIPALVDNGFLTSPNFAFFNLEGEWDVEGVGVSPDYDVDATPEDMYEGMDAQLNKAIELILDGLKNNPPPKAVVPEFPNKTGIGNQK